MTAGGKGGGSPVGAMVLGKRKSQCGVISRALLHLLVSKSLKL